MKPKAAGTGVSLLCQIVHEQVKAICTKQVGQRSSCSVTFLTMTLLISQQ